MKARIAGLENFAASAAPADEGAAFGGFRTVRVIGLGDRCYGGLGVIGLGDRCYGGLGVIGLGDRCYGGLGLGGNL